MSQKKFKEWYTHYYGLHCVAVAGCIMYAAFIPQVVFAGLHLLAFIVATFMHSFVIEGWKKVLYNVLMSLCAVMDVFLVFSGAMGVGAAGYDSATGNCYLN